MKITLVGCGWLGLPLGIELLNEGYIVVGSTTSENKLQHLKKLGFDSFLYDGINYKELPISAKETDFLIINFPPSKSSNYAFQIESLLRQFSTECKVIFTSSISVYENVEGEIDEDGKLDKFSSVYLAERTILEDERPSTIVRLAGLIGENRHPVKYLSGKIVKDCNTVVNLVHLNDVIASIKSILKENKWGEIYNICSAEHPTKHEYYLKAAEEKSLLSPIFEFSHKVGKKVKGDKIERDLNFSYSNPV